MGGGDLNYDLKDFFEGHITAEFNFNIIDVFKQHFRVHNLVVVSFRKDMIIVQTMTGPYTMPIIDTKGLYTTLIPLSSMKEYGFDCNREEVNVIVSRTLLSVNFKSNCINVVADNPCIIYDEEHCGEVKDFVEVTFDVISNLGKDVKFETVSATSFGIFVNEPYKHFLIRSHIDYPIQDDYKDIINLTPNQTVLVDNPKAFKSFCHNNFKITVGKDESIIFEECSGISNVKFCVGHFDCEKDFDLPSFPFKNLFKFLGVIRDDTNFEITKPNVIDPILMGFKINSKFYTTYTIFGVVI